MLQLLPDRPRINPGRPLDSEAPMGRLRRQLAIFCVDCSDLLPNDTKRHGSDLRCKNCIAVRDSAYHKKYRDQRLARGQCERCTDAAVPGLTLCSTCRHRESQRASGYAKRTPGAYRRGNLRKYGITEATYVALLAQQGGRCAICGRERPNGKGHHFHVDHDHASGRLRGLLCHSCNIGIGNLQEDERILHAAIAYLRRHKQESAA